MSPTAVHAELPEAKRRLLDAAMQLMIRQGFTATTVDEICGEAKLTKGSFFHYFKTKEEIGEAALDHYWEAQRAAFLNAEFTRITDPLERLHGFLDFMIQMVRRGPLSQGCLMGNLTQELAHTHPAIRQKCEARFGHFVGNISKTLQAAKAKYRPKADFDPDSVGTLFVSLMQGSILLAKARQDPRPLVDNLNHFRAYVDSLLGQPRGH